MDEIERFVASLAIPADRKTIVLAELIDHVRCAREAAQREGRDADAAERTALGDLEAMRASLEAVEPAFRITRANAFARAALAGIGVAIVVDQLAWLWLGMPATLATFAFALVLAPPRMLELLRAELRAPRVPGVVLRGLPIGPAVTYLYTLMATPYVIWIGMIVARALGGERRVDTPWGAWSLLVAIYLVLLVEGVRARRAATA